MFLPDRHSLKVFLYRKPVDMRKQRNGLAAITKAMLEQDPYSGALFCYVGKRRDRYWDRNGFAVWYKVIETNEKYNWLKHTDADAVSVTADQLEWILDGYDIWKMKKHRAVQFKHASV
jgi:transposase